MPDVVVAAAQEAECLAEFGAPQFRAQSLEGLGAQQLSSVAYASLGRELLRRYPTQLATAYAPVGGEVLQLVPADGTLDADLAYEAALEGVEPSLRQFLSSSGIQVLESKPYNFNEVCAAYTTINVMMRSVAQDPSLSPPLSGAYFDAMKGTVEISVPLDVPPVIDELVERFGEIVVVKRVPASADIGGELDNG